MHTMERGIMIIPFNGEDDRLYDGFQHFPANVVYILYQKKSDLSSKVFDKNVFHYTYNIKVNFEDFAQIMETLTRIYNKEEDTNKMKGMCINISTANPIFTSASYIFASINQKISIIYLFGYNALSIPIIHTMRYTRDEKSVMHALAQKNRFRSVKDVLHDISNFEDTTKDRIKLSRILDKFEDEGLISTKFSGKNRIIRVNDELQNMKYVM